MTNRKRVGIAVPIHLYERLRVETEYSGQTLNALITQILREWLEKQERLQNTPNHDK